MASLNKVMIMGRLGQDPELRYTPSQFAVATLNVATSEVRTGKDGQRQEQTEWHRVIVWGKQAENCHKYLKKGRPVFIEGRLQTRSWEDKNGQKRFTTEIVANNVQFLGAGTGASYQGTGADEYESAAGSADPFATPTYGGGEHRDSFAATSFPKAQQESHSTFGGHSPDLDDIPFMRLSEWGL